MTKTRRRKRVTLEDVAAKAGVSIATASVAIAGRPSGNCRVSPGVAERIRKTARLLKYRPNIQARSLSMQRTQTVAMLIPRSAWHNAIFYLAAAQRLLRQQGFTEIFLVHQDDRLEDESQHLEMCLDRRVEGLIIMPLIDASGRTNVRLINRIYKEEELPIVQLAISLAGCKAPAVVADEPLGVDQAVRRLHAMGHRRIAHCTIKGYDNPSPRNAFRYAFMRYDGYRRAMSDLGLREHILCPPDESKVETEYDDARQIAMDLADHRPLPTAIIAFSDFQAAGLLAGFFQSGVQVPQEMSVIGLGDKVFTRMIRPSLSTIAPAYETLGELATQTLMGMMEGGKGKSVEIPPILQIRQSVAMPAEENGK